MRSLLFLPVFLLTAASSREPLSYAEKPEGTYTLPENSTVTTLLDLISTRPDLSVLRNNLKQCGGFLEAFATPTNWNFTFFAPSDEAFNHTSAYFDTYLATPKGKFWLGNLVQHHYVPNSALPTSNFNGTLARIQTGSYLYVSTQVVDGTLVLNGVAHVTDANLPVTNGIVHVIDRVLDPAAMVFADDIPVVKQEFIAGSCSNLDLPYC